MTYLRVGLFFHEIKRPCDIRLESFRGEFDPQLKYDCRSYGIKAPIHPSVAIGSKSSYSEEYLTPEGFCDGDLRVYDEDFIPIEELAICDIEGTPLNSLNSADTSFFYDQN